MKKIAVSSLVSLLFLSCAVSAPNNERIQYAPTGHPPTIHNSSSIIHNSSTPPSPIKEDFTALAKKYNFAELEKEYKSFSTKALSDAYVKRMFGKYLAPVNSVQLSRQLEFSRYLKNNGDTTYETSLKSMFAQTPSLYDTMTGASAPDIQNKITSDSATFGTYVTGLSPYPAAPVATTATSITSSSFTANWNPVSGATGYKLYVNETEVYSGTNTSFNLTGLTANSTYNYYVKATNNAGNSQNSNNISTTLTVNVPGTPIATAATSITQTSFTANWNTVSGATGYKLIVNNIEVYSGSNTSYNVTAQTPDSTSTYYVKAINDGGTSGNSNTVSVILKTPLSCLSWKNSGSNTNGIYNIDSDNNVSTPKITAYCNMTTDGGGWTLVAAQYENNPISWNEGIQADYDPDLSSKKSFALNTSQLPSDRTQTGFGQDLTPNGIDYVNFIYRTDDIEPYVIKTGIKTGYSYHIHRSASGFYGDHDPEYSGGLGSYVQWHNTLTFDKTGGIYHSWTFSPQHNTSTSRGYAYDGNYYEYTSETYAWTVWVR